MHTNDARVYLKLVVEEPLRTAYVPVKNCFDPRRAYVDHFEPSNRLISIIKGNKTTLEYF